MEESFAGYCMNESSHNFAEYAVVQKKEGKNRRLRLFLVFVYVGFGLAYFGFVLATGWVPLGALLPLLEWMLVFFTWRYVQVEHEYTIAMGTMTFTEIYGARRRKTALTVDCREMSRIAPVGRGYDGELAGVRRRYDFRGSVSSPDSYFAIFTLDGVRSAVFFEGCRKTVKLLKFYNPSATVENPDLRF